MLHRSVFDWAQWPTSTPAAEIRIGTDSFHSPLEDDDIAIRLCERARFTVSVDRPFSSSIVPATHWAKTKEVRSLMVEVRRDVYMNEKTGERLPEFDALSSRVCSLIEFVVLAINNFTEHLSNETGAVPEI